jgi:Mn-dependent DtxR family transcriptional regulator
MVSGPTRTEYVLRQLADQSLVAETSDGRWYLTDDGLKEARRLADERNLAPDATFDEA